MPNIFRRKRRDGIWWEAEIDLDFIFASTSDVDGVVSDVGRVRAMAAP